MSWTYVNAPQDGTIWLEWLSPRQNSGRFPSDGYVWGDPEQMYRHEFNGYTMELLVHQLGFRPGMDHMASHARTRYHFIAKAPNVNAAPPDPSLWIVHYHQAQQNRILPANQVHVDQYTRGMLNERRWLESQGRIERCDFMLHDREHWPNITIPSAHGQQMQNSGPYGANPMSNQNMLMAQNRHALTSFPQPAGPPSAKRQRTQGPAALAGAVEAILDTSIEDEEYTALGDYFDHLTPREISLTRYQQHHKWMEEVFSSPYASANIVPADLGLGLMGELKGLTEGILEPPSFDVVLERNEAIPPIPTEPPPFTNLKEVQLAEFSRRVEEHLEKGQAEIERMKAEHAQTMKDWKKTKQLTHAEEQLRRADWKGHQSALLKFEDGTVESVSGHSKMPHVEDVVERVQSVLGLKIQTHKDADLIEKGGLENEEQVINAALQAASQQASSAPSVAPSEPVSFQQEPAAVQIKTNDHQGARNLATQGLPAQTHNASDEQADLHGVAPERSVENNSRPTGGVDMSHEGMDIDTTDLQFDMDHTADQVDGAQQYGGDSQPAPDMANTSTDAAAPNANPPSANEMEEATAVNLQASVTSTDTAPKNNATDTNLSGEDDTAMFNDSTFNDFTNGLDGGGDELGEGLIDFGAGNDMGMDDSAFGDALHGMDDSAGPLFGEGTEEGDVEGGTS